MWKPGAIWLATFAVAAGDLSEKSHPRLWLDSSSEATLREKLAHDPLAARLQTVVMTEAQRILKARTCRYEIPDGLRLLAESRLAVHNILNSAWAWRMSGEEKFRLRAIAELEAACALKDWNPKHFLDTAEMATAVATGYDWLYQTLTPKERAMCERAIIEKALKPAKAVYDTGGWWAKPHNNWSQVCGSGIALAAAAVAGKDEGLAQDLFDRGLRLVESCGKFYAPDGMYPEGPGYWHYGSDYHVMLLAASQVLGRPIGDTTLVHKGGDAIMHLTSPTRLAFNFADSHAKVEMATPAQCWLALEFKDAAQAGHVRELFTRALDEGGKALADERSLPLSLLWLPPAPFAGTPRPTSAVFNGEQAVAIFRTGWDAEASWFAIKGGTPAASHGHMDVGSFVYDAHGVRWLHDLGSDNYNLPGYFGDKRWNYFRLQNRSHNTLEIDGKLQNSHSKPCPVIDSTPTGNSVTATFDLSDAYAGAAERVVRLAGFDTLSGIVRIVDQITKPTGSVCWRAFTDAEAEIQGDQVILRKKGKQITLKRVAGVGVWSITNAKPPTPEENQNKGFRAVVLTIPKADSITTAVEIRP